MAEFSEFEKDLRSETKETADRSRRLFLSGMGALALVLCYFGFTSSTEDSIQLYEGLVMLTLAALPSLMWAKRGGNQLPTFEVLMLTTANSYALPMLNSNEDLKAYAVDVVSQCGFVVIFFQLIAIVTHAAIGGRPGTSSFYSEEVLTRDIQKYIGYGLVLSTLYTFVYVYHEDWIRYDINSILRAVFYGIGLVTTFVQSRRWGLDDLSPGERTSLVALLACQVIMQFSTLFLVGGISIIVLAIVGYVAGSRRLPIGPIVAFLALVALLHNGKSTMRERYWGENSQHVQVAFGDLLPFYSEWIQNGVSLKSDSGDKSIAKKLVQRTSLLQMLCLVAANTPEIVPYLGGETYAQIPGQFVPRFFWPEKPVGQISNNTLSMRYGLQDEDATLKTTIGFGMLAEAYANFGYFGVGFIAFFLGAFYKKVQVLSAKSPFLSYAGLYLVVLMAWSFQTEFTLSIWLSSMFQACVAVMGIPFIIRNIFG